MESTVAEKLKDIMTPGRVYRRGELAPYSNNLSRDLEKLVATKLVVRAAPGLYYRPGVTSVGPAPAAREELVRAFLNTDDFLFVSFNEYNLLDLGLTQLYNQQFVYNRKRDGKFVLDGRQFTFRRQRDFPAKLTKEFLFVDLFNNRKELAGNTSELEKLVAQRAREVDQQELVHVARYYGKVATRKFFEELTAI